MFDFLGPHLGFFFGEARECAAGFNGLGKTSRGLQLENFQCASVNFAVADVVLTWRPAIL